MAAAKKERKPAHLEMVGGKSTRQLIWQAIRARRDGFAVVDIACAADADMDTTKTYLRSLEKGGFVVVINPVRGGHDEKCYQLIKDNGLEAPRLTRDGKPVEQGQAQEQMWRTMRILGADFNCQELAGFASTTDVMVSTEAAKSYLKNLAHAGYVTVVAPMKGRGASRTFCRYRFNPARYTGPRPPMIQRSKNVYDPNLGQVVWQQEVDHDDL